MQVTAVLMSYNRSCFLNEALEGVAGQDYSDYRILVSDCSDDPAVAAEIESIVGRFQKTYPQIDCHLLRHPRRMPQAAHVEAALAEVSTPFAALLDDDDYWMPHHLSRAVDWLQADARNGILLSNGLVVDGDGAELSRLTNRSDLAIPSEEHPGRWMEWELRTFYGTTSGFVFRMDALKGWSFPIFPCIDIHITVGVLANGYRCRGCPEPSYYYRVHGSSNYKNEELFYVRHQWRRWLGLHHGWQVTRLCPKFPLLWLKSLFARKKRR